MLRIYLKFIATVVIITIVSLNVVAHNFSRLTGTFIEKPYELVFHKGDLYVSVVNYKTKFSGKETEMVLEHYRNYLPDNEALFEVAKKWYNMTKMIIENIEKR